MNFILSASLVIIIDILNPSLFMIPAAESRGDVVDIALAVHQCGWDLIPDLWSYGLGGGAHI